MSKDSASCSRMTIVSVLLRTRQTRKSPGIGVGWCRASRAPGFSLWSTPTWSAGVLVGSLGILVLLVLGRWWGQAGPQDHVLSAVVPSARPLWVAALEIKGSSVLRPVKYSQRCALSIRTPSGGSHPLPFCFSSPNTPSCVCVCGAPDMCL